MALNLVMAVLNETNFLGFEFIACAVHILDYDSPPEPGKNKSARINFLDHKVAGLLI